MTHRIRGRAGVKLRQARLARTSHLCEMCWAKGITRQATVVDHRLALAHGGLDVDENTQNLCDSCHDAKTRKEFNLRPARQPIGADGWPLT